VNWNLLMCAVRPHVSYAPTEPAVRDRVSAETPAGAAWQCLRCGTFVPGPPAASGPAAAAPRVRRDDELRSALILRAFAVERFLRGVLFGFIAYGIWRFKYSRLSVEHTFNREYPEVRSLLHELGYNIDRSGLVGLIRHTFALDQRTLTWLAIGAAAYTVVEFLEAIALWGLRRWGEYFAFVATSAGIPYELYELAAKVTALRLTAFLVNVALLAYLVLSKRLLGVRGGKAAYEARLRSESIMQAAIDAAAAESQTPAPAAAPAPAPTPPSTSAEAGPGPGPAEAAAPAPAPAKAGPGRAEAAAPAPATAEAGPASSPPR
jgi:uncharacterized membrane protein (DUF2068 family)